VWKRPLKDGIEVLAGGGETFHERSNGRRQIVDLLLPGDVFGFGLDGKHFFNADRSSSTSKAQ